MDFYTAGQLLIRYSAFVKYMRNNGNKMWQYISCLLTSKKLMIRFGGSFYIIFSLCFWYPYETGRPNQKVSEGNI